MFVATCCECFVFVRWNTEHKSPTFIADSVWFCRELRMQWHAINGHFFARSKDGIQALCSLDHSRSKNCQPCCQPFSSTCLETAKAQSRRWDPPGSGGARKNTPVPTQRWWGAPEGPDWFRKQILGYWWISFLCEGLYPHFWVCRVDGDSGGFLHQLHIYIYIFDHIICDSIILYLSTFYILFASEEKAVQTANAWRKMTKKLQKGSKIVEKLSVAFRNWTCCGSF